MGAYAPPAPRWARAGGLRLAVYSRSLGPLMAGIFVLSWLAQSVAGTAAHNAQQLSQWEDPVSWGGYVTSPDLWSRTLQLAVGVPCGRVHGGLLHLPAPARVTGVQTGGQPARATGEQS